MIDFLSVLNNSNSIKNDKTGEITLTTPIIQTDGKFAINSSCKITSNCNTVIQSEIFAISTSSVSLSNISFQTSIIIKENENISIKQCTVKNAKSAEGAIEISDSQNILLSHVTITDSKDIPGIFIYQCSSVSADNLLMHDLDKSFIAVNDKSHLTITDSTFHHTNGNSFYVAGQSCIEISNCSISHTSYPSLFIRNSQCIAKSNVFQDTTENAISVHSSKCFVIEKNTIRNVADTAIQISDDSAGVIKDNTIYEVEGNGIYCNKSDLQIENNEIFDLVYPAIAITSRSRASLIGNKVTNIKHSGICIRHAKEVKIQESEIKDINESGISVSDTENCIIQNNIIMSCDIASVEAYNKSNVIVNNNAISDIGKDAFSVFTSGYMKAENNRVCDVKNSLVKLSYKGGGDFINNDVSNCLKQSDCKTCSCYFLAGNGDFKSVTNDPSRLSNENLTDFDDHRVEKDSMCIKCHKNMPDCHLLQCGHKVFCKECADLALQNNENCPLCRFPIMTVSNGYGVDNDDVCMICCVNKPDCIVLPCGHMGTCSFCLESWFNSNQSCPICRTEPCLYKQIVNDI